MVQRIGTTDSATPHPDPCGGQAPALHFLIPPSTIGLQFGTFRRRRAGMEGDWRAHFRTNDEMGGRLCERIDGSAIQSLETLLGLGMMKLRIPGQIGQGVTDREYGSQFYVSVLGDRKQGGRFHLDG